MPQNLIATEIALPGREVTSDVLADEALSDIFGIDLDTEDDAFTVPEVPKKTAAKPKRSTRPKRGSSPKQPSVPAGTRPKKGTTKRPGARAAKKTASPSHANLSVTSTATARGTRAATPESSRLRVTGAWIVRAAPPAQSFGCRVCPATGCVGVDRLSLGTHVRKPQPATPGPGGFASPPRTGSIGEGESPDVWLRSESRILCRVLLRYACQDADSGAVLRAGGWRLLPDLSHVRHPGWRCRGLSSSRPEDRPSGVSRTRRQTGRP